MQCPIPHRVVVYPKDVMNITGLRQRASRNLLADIRKKYHKQPGAFVTVREFCQYMGLTEDLVGPFLRQ